jgi:GNAT superfamily N-acetyltransferase
MSELIHNLDFERTDDMSVLFDFYCGIKEMDDYIHKKLQAKIDNTKELESFVVKEDGIIVGMTALREKPLEIVKTDGSRFTFNSLEIEYLAVKKELRETGIGATIIKWIYDKAKSEHPDCKFLGVLAYVDHDYGYSAVPFYEKCHFIARKGHALAEAIRMTRIIKQD